MVPSGRSGRHPSTSSTPSSAGSSAGASPPWDVVDGEVLEIEPHRRLVTTEGIGILDGVTQVIVTFESVEHGTRITVVRAGFGTGTGWQDQLEGHRHG
jgi:uncharacterized protein YndB with AHSA1/START domain